MTTAHYSKIKIMAIAPKAMYQNTPREEADVDGRGNKMSAVSNFLATVIISLCCCGRH